ncbi:type II toxin-antitoxin system HipA family toxin YjjJ [Comamonas endophytica]|uniref:Type II toxin-antitoxin system HipA family toxin YjjJ n=1 Tax=Comamonas endophytica TaxID=2949090 RepID=A0ABY6GG58_9BURK|nr:type II toxin-antitoxin system HipA family toxin YjjJ [Acidovorax sp. 5MLIR]MCD2513295.1 type II toxin-antitoxin system HipA family toxin YjjJ [Acidovorax sp. D4N7]UYG53362.1 type II toxin-antitoxin system HipA family toxin YjjJ [Acidovorax sp. 5MLIR]
MNNLHAQRIEQLLASGPRTSQELCVALAVSQPTMSRVLKSIATDVLKVAIQGAIHYALQDKARAHLVAPVSRVTAEGQLQRLGVLRPVRPEGFVLVAEGGKSGYTDGLPWWLFDMRPQGYLGRAYARRNAAVLRLPERLGDWSDADVIQALQQHGHDLAGNLLVGERAEQMFIDLPAPEPVALQGRARTYVALAASADAGELPGSSAGGEQPKFTAYVQTQGGPAHVIVKFSAREDNAVAERWRDLLLAEHHALETLHAAGVPAARSAIVDSAGQRFLEVVRFDRIGALGRSALLSLAALDAEFVGQGGNWFDSTQALAREGQVLPEAVAQVQLLWAYGVLIGNTDMHAGNLSFTSESGRPYRLAPAYDMTPMAFAPRTGGAMADTLRPARIIAAISGAIWREAHALALRYAERLRGEKRLSPRFAPCVAATAEQLEQAMQRIERIA